MVHSRSSRHSRSPDSRGFGTATYSSRSGSYRSDDDDGSSLPPIGSPDISNAGSSAYMRRNASPSSHSRSHSHFSSHHDDYYEGDSTVEYEEADSVAQVEENIQLDDDEEDEDFYSEAGPTTARTHSPTRSVSYADSHSRSPSRTQTYDSRSPSRTQTYTSASRGPTRTNSPTRTYDSRSPSRTQTYDDAQTYDDDDRTYDDNRTYDDARSHDDDAQTYEDDARTYEDDARTYEDDDAATYDDARTYEDDRSEARTYDEEGASVYDDGRSGYDDGKSAAYSNSGGKSEGYSAARSEGYSATRSEGYSGTRSEGFSGSRSEAYSNSGGRSEGYSGTLRSGEYDDGRSAGYDDGHSAGYDDAQSAGYDDARTYDEASESGSRAYEDETYRSETQTGYPQSEAQTYARSETQAHSRARSDDAHTQYSTEDGTDATSSVSPEEILASLHQMTLDPVNFERKVLSTVEEQTERSSSQLSRTSSLHQGPGSDISRGTRRSGSHTRGSSDAGSLFSPSTHGSYLSPSGPGTTQPLSLFSPLLPPKTTEPSPLGLKEKESIESLNRHPSASMGRRAGELIAFFESGGSGTGRPVSPTKSDASFVSAASGAGAAAAVQPRSSNGSGSFGPMASPGKMSTSLSTFTRTFTGTGGSGSASGSAVGSGSYTGSGSDLGSGSMVSSPFARSRGTGVGLGFDALFSPSFPTARAGSPFRPASPTKSVASGASGSYVSGTHKEDAASETYRTGGSRSDTARSETNRSDTYRSETNRSDTYRSETNQSGTYCSETNQSGTYRSNGSDAYRSNGSDTYRSGTGASESVTVRSAGSDAYRPGGSNGSVRSRSVASESYRSGPGTYTGTGTGTGSGTYRAGSGSGRSRSVASESYNSDTYMTGTGSDTYRAGGSDAGVSGFLSSMYPRGSDSGTQTVTGSRAGSQGRSESGFSQGRSDGGFSQGRSDGGLSQGRSEGTYSPERAATPTQGRSEGGFSQGPSTYGRRSQTYQPSEAYTQDTATYTQGSATYTQSSGTYVPAAPASYTEGSDTYTQGSRSESPSPPPVPPKSPTTPRASRQRVDTPLMPTTPKTPNQHHEDKFADWQDRTPQAGDTPYTANIPLTPKTIGSMTPRTQAGAMTPRTPGGRFGKALSEASTAPTSAEGMLRQRMSREIVTSVPVPSESEAIGLGHNGQDPLRISALWYLNVHAPPPFEWLRTQAVLYPNLLILTWIAPTGGRGVVTLDLVNCTEVRSAPSPSHPSARDDVGSVAARLQSPELAETLCPFQLLYADGVERLGTDTARERVRWVGAIWEVLATISRAPTRAVTERSASPVSSLQRSSSVRSSSSEGSASTQFVPPFDAIPDMASTLSRQSSFAMPYQTADDMSVNKLIPPARTPSLRRTASMADMELEADIDRALNRSSASTGVPVTVTSGASQGRSTLMSPPPGRRRSGPYTESEASGFNTPSATDHPRSSFYSPSNLTGRDDTYVPTDTEVSTVRGVRIEADTLSFRGSNSASMRDTHDALSTGYGSGRSEGIVSTATYSRRRTLSAVSPSSGLSRSGGLRRPKRDRTQSLSPAAADRVSISPVDGYSTASERLSVPRSGSQVSFASARSPVRSISYESASEGSQGVSTYGSIGYEVCETSDMSEFTIDQTESRTRSRTATSGTARVVSPTKVSEEFITADSCQSTDFETVTVCPPSTDYEDAQKCICPPSIEEVSEVIVESSESVPTPVPVPIELSPPPSMRPSSRRSPSELTLEQETMTAAESTPSPMPIELSPMPSQRSSSRRTLSVISLEPEVFELTPPPSQRPSSIRSPSVLTAIETEVIELTPPPSQRPSSYRSPSMNSIEQETSIVSPSMHTPSSRTRSLQRLTISSPARTPVILSPSEQTPTPLFPGERTPTARTSTEGTLSDLTPSPSLSTLLERSSPEMELTLFEPSTGESPTISERPSTPSERPPSTVPTIPGEEEPHVTPRASPSPLPSPSIAAPRPPPASTRPPRPISLTFPSPAPMTISESSGAEDWLASPSSIALSLGRSPLVAPSIAEVLPPGLEHPVARTPASSTMYHSPSLSSEDSISSFPDVSPPRLTVPSIPEEGSSLYRSGSISSVGSLSTVSDLPPLHAPHLPVPSTALHSRSVSSVASISASVPSIREAFRRHSPSATHRSRSLSSEPSMSASAPSLEGTPRLQVPSTTHRSRSVSSEDSLSASVPTMESSPRLQIPSTTHRSRSVSSEDSLSASMPSLRDTPRPRVPSKVHHARSVSSEGTISGSMPSIRSSPQLGVPSTTHRSRSVSSEDSLSASMPTIEGTPRVHIPSTTHRSRSISSEDSLALSMPTIEDTPRPRVHRKPHSRSISSEGTLSASMPSFRDSPHIGVPSTSRRSRSISSEGSLSASVPTIGATPRAHVPSTLHRSHSISSEDSLSASMPTIGATPRLQVPSTTHRSRTLSSERTLSISAPSVISSMVSRTSVESPLSPTVSSASFTTMPTIIAPPAAPPTPSPVYSPSLTTISSLTTSIPMTPTATVPITVAPPSVISFTPSATVQRSGSTRSTWTMESDRTYDSADLRPSPPFIPVDLPSVAEYEPSYSGLEDTMSVISSASPGYDVIRHHVSPPSAASMDSGLIDRSSPEISRGSDRRPSLTPSRIEESLSSESTITLPPLPPSPERTVSLHTTSASSISLTTPVGNKPSIESEETVYSDGDLAEGGVPPSHIISHDVNRLLQYLHDVDTVREGETRDMSDHLRRIEEELFDLSAFLRQPRPSPPPAQPQYVPYPVQVPAPAPAPVLVPVAAPEPARQPPPIPPRPPVEHAFEEYVPMSDASTDVSLSDREEQPTPIPTVVPPRAVSEVSFDLSESIELMSDRASTIPSVTLSEESSVSGSMLSSSAVTSSPSLSASAMSEDLLQTPSHSVREPLPTPISLRIPSSPAVSSTATPELSPPSSRSSSSAELAGLTPSPSVQPEVLPDVTIKSSSPALTKSPSISAATERSTPIPQHVPAKRVQSLSPPPIRRPSPVSESDYFISSPLSQDTFRDLPRAYSASPTMSVISIKSQETAKPDSKGSMGIEDLRNLLKDLLKQQD
ncbi:hypothetical protein FRC09_001859, partial [Ceratobasidium sp. 395]